MENIQHKTQPSGDEIYEALKKGGSIVYGGGNIKIAQKDGTLNLFFGDILEMTGDFTLEKIKEVLDYIHIYITKENN